MQRCLGLIFFVQTVIPVYGSFCSFIFEGDPLVLLLLFYFISDLDISMVQLALACVSWKCAFLWHHWLFHCGPVKGRKEAGDASGWCLPRAKVKSEHLWVSGQAGRFLFIHAGMLTCMSNKCYPANPQTANASVSRRSPFVSER